ncbi:MAG: DUF2752 domain-containing protein [Acidimicrobiales bacterium]
MVVCPFRRCTGGYCPGCGATRAGRALFSGDLAASWGHHPWVILAAFQLAVAGGAWVMFERSRRERFVMQMRMPALAVNLILLLAIWVIRLQAGTIPRFWA